MRSIESPRFATISLVLAAICIVVSASALPATRPRYGGTLRVELRAAKVSLDPREWKTGSLESATDEKLAALLFERLISLDNYGRFQPALATDWSHDGSNRRWQFTIRPGVKFSDGTPLNSSDVAAALQPLLPEILQISPAGNTVVVQCTSPVPDMLEKLASGRYFIYRGLADGTLVGTGPFVASETLADSGHLSFRANAESWSGRPFLDAVDVALGVPPLRAMFDLQLGKADLVELAPDLVPRSKQASLRVWTSEANTLYALRFDDAQNEASGIHLREALSLSLDRGTMASVLLQKQAEPAAALLPQWLSGYAFLFHAETDLERAKELRRSPGAHQAVDTEPLRLLVDPPGELAKLLAERVAVNARQAGILVQVIDKPVAHANSAPSEAEAGVHLFAWRYSSLSPREELDSFLAAYNLTRVHDASAVSADPEQLYAREKDVLEEWRVLPLVTEAESVGLSPAVRDWMPGRWGEWHLADVWLEVTQAESAGPPNAAGAGEHAFTTSRTAAPGVKP